MNPRLPKVLMVAVALGVGLLGGGCTTAVIRVNHCLSSNMGPEPTKLPPYPAVWGGPLLVASEPSMLPLFALDLPASLAADTLLLPYDLYQLSQ